MRNEKRKEEREKREEEREERREKREERRDEESNGNIWRILMMSGKKLALVLIVFMIAASCTSTGEYMPLSKDETVIGTVQAVFEVKSFTFFWKTKNNIDAVNKQAYIKLLEAAGKKYSGNIDIRDIVWVTGKSSVDHEYTEVSASGKVVQME